MPHPHLEVVAQDCPHCDLEQRMEVACMLIDLLMARIEEDQDEEDFDLLSHAAEFLDEV